MILFSILVTSCAIPQKTVPREVMTQDIDGYELPVLPTKSTSVVYVVRPDIYVGSLIPFKISIDDRPEKLVNSSVVVYVLQPGAHTFFAKAENKNVIPFTTEAGQVYFYQVNPRWGVFMAQLKTESIDEVAGTYQVKHLFTASSSIVSLVDEEIQLNNKAKKQVAGKGNTELEHITIRWNVNTRPQGADCYWRVKSSTPDVKNQNEKYLAPSPYESTETYDIKGLSRANAGDVQVEIRCTKKGYMEQKKVFNMLSVIDEKEISIMMPLVKE